MLRILPIEGSVTASDKSHLRGILYGLAGAALFGASAPFSKLLLARAEPLVLAGLLYLGGGLAAALASLAVHRPEAPLRKSDAGLLAGVLVAGGLLGPVLMLAGLARTSAVAGALMLNLEAPFTILLAVGLFREHLGARQALASSLVIGGAALMGLSPGEWRADPLGLAALAAACACWALDNNLTQKLSGRDPLAIVRVKALGAGALNLALGLAVGQHLPRAPSLGGALALGAGSYGLSIVFAVLALRELGAARQAAFFATAPFAGALLAIPLVGERLRAPELGAMAAMAVGAFLLARERHSHSHVHEALVHEHVHVHDAHHQHAHDGPVTEPHSHVHRHEPLTHEHPHVSDAHHHHSH